MGEEVKLKPCPFCGGKASSGCDDVVYETVFYFCTTCAAQGPSDDDDLHVARAKWNARATRTLTGTQP